MLIRMLLSKIFINKVGRQPQFIKMCKIPLIIWCITYIFNEDEDDGDSKKDEL